MHSTSVGIIFPVAQYRSTEFLYDYLLPTCCIIYKYRVLDGFPWWKYHTNREISIDKDCVRILLYKMILFYPKGTYKSHRYWDESFFSFSSIISIKILGFLNGNFFKRPLNRVPRSIVRGSFSKSTFFPVRTVDYVIVEFRFAIQRNNVIGRRNFFVRFALAILEAAWTPALTV